MKKVIEPVCEATFRSFLTRHHSAVNLNIIKPEVSKYGKLQDKYAPNNLIPRFTDKCYDRLSFSRILRWQ